MADKKELSIDKALDRLEEINRQLEEKEMTLEDSLKLYKEGTELAGKLKKQLEGVEKELIILSDQP